MIGNYTLECLIVRELTNTRELDFRLPSLEECCIYVDRPYRELDFHSMSVVRFSLIG